MSQDNGSSKKIQRQLFAKKGAWYGKVYMEFGVTEAFEFSSPEEQRAGFAKLQQIVDFEHSMYMEDFKRNPSAYNNTTQAPAQGKAVTGEVFEEITEIVMNVSDGKPQYRAKTPKYHQFGIPIYEDMKEFALVKELLNGGYSVKPDGYVAYHVESGKGRKVTDIEKKF